MTKQGSIGFIFSLISASSPLWAQGLYYKLETVAETDNFTSVGETIKSFRSTSINESGIIAMAAIVDDGGAEKQGMYVSGASNVPLSLGTSADNRRTGFANINAAGQVCAWEGFLTGSRQSLIRIWDASNPGAIPSPLNTNNGSGLDVILTPPSIANDGTVLFPATAPRRLYLNSLGVQNSKFDVGSIAPNGQPWVADGGAYVLREGQTTGGFLSYASAASPRKVIATTGADAFFQIGNLAGISNSGKVVAFAAEDLDDGPGIYLFINEPGNPDFNQPVRLLGFPGSKDGLGYDDNGKPVTFESFDLLQRVGVEHRPGGPGGIEGDSILVSFIATPSSASFTNPHTVSPMLYTKNPALWVVHLTPSRDLAGTSPVRLDHKTSPMPVVQVGQFFGPLTVTSLATWDPLAFAEKTPVGSGRVTIGPADHYLAVEAGMSDGTVRVLRATQLDTDFDGLFDHWEQANGGIDVDLDGTVDLKLSDFGADPNRKDAFFEIDWSKEWRPESFTDQNGNGGYNFGEPFDDVDGNGAFTVGRYEPDAAALQKIASQFANAPVPNPVGPDGITAHIDAGIARSINLPSMAVNGGGDLLASPVGNKFIHLVYADAELYQSLAPGTVILPYGEVPVEVLAGDLAKRYFGNLEKNARELAFRHISFVSTIAIEKFGDATGLGESPLYAFRKLEETEFFDDDDGNCKWTPGDPFVDANGNNVADPGEMFFDVKGDGFNPGEAFGDTNGNGRFDGVKIESFDSMPGNSIIMGLEGIDSRLTENGMIRVFFPKQGVPSEIPVPPGFFHYQVLYHEIGHLFTLNHGGDDGDTLLSRPTIKPQYRSLMNYAYTELPDENGQIIDNYSNESGPGTFNDWSIFRMDFCRHFDSLGDHRLGARFAPGLTEGDSTEVTPHRSIGDIERLLGPLGPVDRPKPRVGGDAIPEDLTDRDRDGLQLLLEVALGLDPDFPDLQNSPLKSGTEGVGAEAAYFLLYPRDSSLGIAYRVEYTEDLKTWKTNGLEETTIMTAGTVETRKAILPRSVAAEAYFRLVVTRQP